MEFDPGKDAANVAKHGLSLTRASELMVEVYVEDDRLDYGERRFRAYGLLDGKAHCLALTFRDGVVRAISLRRAHSKEYRRHVR